MVVRPSKPPSPPLVTSLRILPLASVYLSLLPSQPGFNRLRQAARLDGRDLIADRLDLRMRRSFRDRDGAEADVEAAPVASAVPRQQATRNQ